MATGYVIYDGSEEQGLAIIRQPISLSAIFGNRKILQVPRHMKPAKQWVNKWVDMINLHTGRAGQINFLYGRVVSPNRATLDCGSTLRCYSVDDTRISLLVGGLSSRNPLRVPIFPSLGHSSCSFGILGVPSSGCDFSAGLVTRVPIQADYAPTAGDIPFRIMAVLTRDACIKSLQA